MCTTVVHFSPWSARSSAWMPQRLKLDHVDAVLLERAGLLVEERGERHRELHLVAVVAVGERVDDGHRPGKGHLDLLLRMRAQQPRLGRVDPALQLQRPDHHRHHGVVAVVADAHLHLVLEVDSLDVLEEPVHEVLARLLAVADDVHAGVLLLLQPEQGGVPLGALQLGAPGAPGGPELLRFGKPIGLGQAAGDRGLEHFSAPVVCAVALCGQRRNCDT
jgi:hypothetical protein